MLSVVISVAARPLTQAAIGTLPLWVITLYVVALLALAATLLGWALWVAVTDWLDKRRRRQQRRRLL